MERTLVPVQESQGDDVDIRLVLALAEQLRGVPLRTDQWDRLLTHQGEYYYRTMTIFFNDGAEWEFMTPAAAVVSDGLAAQSISSEVATLRLLATQTTIPVVTVFAFR